MNSSSWFSASEDRSFEVLWHDGERVLGRTWRNGADGDRNAVLAVLPAAEHPAPSSLRRLAHEYELKDKLDGAWALRPLELVRERGRTMLVLEDPGGEPLDRLLGAPMKVGGFLRLAIGIASALGKVHESGLIHKDIKPANIVVGAADGHVRLTGFGIASRLSRERRAPGPPETIAGTLAYMAPEQTGRTNRSIDARSDLYALGATFYQMLTSTLPFTAAEPMEWIHCHIARRPVPPIERLENVPAPVSAIVMKLLAKTPEERYQTSSGIVRDLRRCLTEWEARRRIDDFPLGLQDTPIQLLIPERLYGRDHEIATLLACFDRMIKNGAPELVLLSGYSGIGKSSIVNELHKALVPSRGLFAVGKFDQYKRGIPYATLAQAFQSLVRQLLCKSDAELAHWRNALTEALGLNGQLMINLIPELALIIGEQPLVPDLSGPEAQSRFVLVFRQFVEVFARKEHPLVLFLDDLQWLDPATLDVFAYLATEPEVGHLLLVGAYRDNEVGPSHSLTRRLEIIRGAGRALHEIVLGGIRPEDVAGMIADTLDANRQEIGPLAAIVFEKTGGNPFFTIQFVGALADEDLLTYDSQVLAWRWDIDRIKAKRVGDNVVDLMIERLSRLPDASLQALKRLACIGHGVEIAKFQEINETSHQDTQNLLHEAVRTGLLFQIDDSYAFAHDRVHEAAYAMLPEPERSETHRRIGSRMLEALRDTEADAQIFEIASQFNRGQIGRADLAERATAASLNLRAGRKAKASAAYAAACGYLAEGLTQLGEEGWRTHYELAFALALEHAECTFLSGEFDEAERMIARVLGYAATSIDIAAVHRLKIELHVVKSENDKAVESAIAALRLFGINLSPHPNWIEVEREYDNIWKNLNGRPIESLAFLPEMTDPHVLAAMRILAEIWPPAYFTDFNLTVLTICHMVSLSLVHGAATTSNQGYALLGWVMGPAFNRYADGYRIALLAWELASKRNVLLDIARTGDTMGLTSSWTQPLTASIDWSRIAYRTGVEAGDVYFACYSSAHISTHLLLRGHDLQQAAEEVTEYLNFARSIGFRDGADLIVTTERTIASLRGLTRGLSDFSDAEFDGAAFEAELTDARMNVVVYWYWTRKIMLHFLSGNHQAALAASDKVQPGPWVKIIQVQHLDYHYYTALALAASIEQASTEQRDTLQARLAAHYDQLRTWAQETRSPTFADKHVLVAAEIAHLEGRELDAERLYEDSIRLAHQNGFLQNEAVANELAARFYSGRDFRGIARSYLRDARYCYLRWGADGKVRQIDELYPHASEEQRQPSSTSTTVAPVEHMDLATVIRVSQAVSGEIVPDKLMETLMRTAIEHAGAERAVLLLTRGVEQQVEAEATTSGDCVIVRLRKDSISETPLPKSIVHYVARTRENVILEDARNDSTFSEDAYIHQHGARSLLCLPLTNQTKLTGLLYLENNLAPRVFTPARLAVLKLLASQAAISLENTRLYRDLEEREAKIRRLVDANIIGIFIFDFENRILEANDAFLHMVGYDRDEFVAGRVLWTDLTPPEWCDRHARAAAELKSTGTVQPYEREYLRKDGRRVPALIGSAAFGEQRDQGVAFVLDLTEQKRAEAEARESERRFREVEIELAHANRVTTMGQLTASIAHEVNQPLAAVIVNAQAALHWMDRDPPDLWEVEQALDSIAKDGMRASNVIDRMRALFKKASPSKASLDINEALGEVIALTRGEAVKNGVAVDMQLANGLPAVRGDRVQLQQVILNLIMNAIEAMSGLDEAAREVRISTEMDASGCVLVTVRDWGPGLDSQNMARLFEAFYTTKPNGMGMGLAICRSIIEAHGGRLWAKANEPRGAVFQFSLPADRDETAPAEHAGEMPLA